MDRYSLPDLSIRRGLARAQVAVLPVRVTTDANGVDLYRGAYHLRQTYLSLGSNSLGIAYTRSWIGEGSIGGGGIGWRDSMVGGIDLARTNLTVSIGATSESFGPSGSSYVSLQGTGATLTFDGLTNKYTYKTTDGMTAIFDQATAVIFDSCCQVCYYCSTA